MTDGLLLPYERESAALREVRDGPGRRVRIVTIEGPPQWENDDLRRYQKVTHETRFREVVRAIHRAGYMPTPSRILFCCHRTHTFHGLGRQVNLNGRESTWRAEELARLGYRKNVRTGRWEFVGRG